MLGTTYLDFIRYFYCTCLTLPPDPLSRFRNLAGATQRIKINKIESQVAPAEEADMKSQFIRLKASERIYGSMNLKIAICVT